MRPLALPPGTALGPAGSSSRTNWWASWTFGKLMSPLPFPERRPRETRTTRSGPGLAPARESVGNAYAAGGQIGWQAYWPAVHPAWQLIPVTLTQTEPIGHCALLVVQLPQTVDAAKSAQTVVFSTEVMHEQRLLPLQKEYDPVRVQTSDPSAQVPCPLPQTFGVPRPPQVCPGGQLPQLRNPPHPSSIVPQFFPCATHVVGVQPQTPGVPGLPPPQVSGGGHPTHRPAPLHVPHGSVSQVVPTGAWGYVHVPPVQVAPTAVRQTGGAVQMVVPPPQVPLWQVLPVVQASPSSHDSPSLTGSRVQRLAAQVDRRQMVGAGGQVPQSSVPPQPSPMESHWAPCAAQVVGVQPH